MKHDCEVIGRLMAESENDHTYFLRLIIIYLLGYVICLPPLNYTAA